MKQFILMWKDKNDMQYNDVVYAYDELQAKNAFNYSHTNCTILSCIQNNG